MILKGGGSLKMRIREGGDAPSDLVLFVKDERNEEPDVVFLRGMDVATLIDAIDKRHAVTIKDSCGKTLIDFDFDASVNCRNNVSFLYDISSDENAVTLNEAEMKLFLAGIASLAWRLWS